MTHHGVAYIMSSDNVSKICEMCPPIMNLCQQFCLEAANFSKKVFFCLRTRFYVFGEPRPSLPEVPDSR